MGHWFSISDSLSNLKSPDICHESFFQPTQAPQLTRLAQKCPLQKKSIITKFKLIKATHWSVINFRKDVLLHSLVITNESNADWGPNKGAQLP